MDRARLVEARDRPGRLPLTGTAAVLLGISALIACARIWAELRYFDFVRDGTFGLYNHARYSSRVNAVNDLAAAAALMLVPTGIVFILWFRRAYRNLPGLGIFNLRWRRGWAVGAWFVPILNLFRPAQIAAAIWRCSDPRLPRQSSPPGGPVSPALGWWWGTWLASGVALGFGSATSRNANSSSDLETASFLRLAGEALSIAAAVLAIAVVFDVARRQKLRAAVLAGEARLWPSGLQTSSLTTAGLPSESTPRDVASLSTPGGPACPSCGFENHPYAPSCLSCHTRLEPQL